MNKVYLPLLMLVLEVALLLCGCVSQPQGVVAKSNYDTLGLWLESDHTRAQPGSPIQIRYTVKNMGERAWILESQDTPVMDIVVDVVGGTELFALSAQSPDKVAHRLEWKPGESKVIELTWIPKQEDVRFGMYHDVFLTGLLYNNGKIVQSAGVIVCASNFCR